MCVGSIFTPPRMPSPPPAPKRQAAPTVKAAEKAPEYVEPDFVRHAPVSYDDPSNPTPSKIVNQAGQDLGDPNTEESAHHTQNHYKIKKDMKKTRYPDVRIEVVSSGLMDKLLGRSQQKPSVVGEEKPTGKNLPDIESKKIGAKLVFYKGKRINLEDLPIGAKGRSLKNYDFECGLFCEEKL